MTSRLVRSGCWSSGCLTAWSRSTATSPLLCWSRGTSSGSRAACRWRRRANDSAAVDLGRRLPAVLLGAAVPRRTYEASVKPYNYDEHEMARLQRLAMRLPTRFSWSVLPVFGFRKKGAWIGYGL